MVRGSWRGRDAGFTLPELLVTMLVIAILAAIAIPVFISQTHKAGDGAAETALDNVALQIETYAGDVTTGYTSVSPASLAADQLPVNVGPNVSVYLIQHTSKGYCLAAFSSQGSALPTTEAAFKSLSSNVIFWYDSQAGGLQPASTSITNYSGCPVTTGLASDAGTSRWG